jgi:hypothetical protein
MMANLSITFAVRDKCSEIWMPGTFVGIGLKIPRYSLGASGFMSHMSCWGAPPICQIRMHAVCFGGPAAQAVLMFAQSHAFNPNKLAEPIRTKSRRFQTCFGAR